MLSSDIYQKARLSRDKRFDGSFFVAVKSTEIYCRPICPAKFPLEKNVLYFVHAIEAANAGFRPCLRCRPDSAPGSPAWQGTHTTFSRAINLIKQGVLQDGTLSDLTNRLGISDRYLRQLFQKYLGTSPKNYALYQQCLFAKQLLHQTSLPITQVALASGFGSIRRFNDYFRTQLKITPSAIRNSGTKSKQELQLHLSYRPPYNWEKMQKFLMARLIPELEWCENNSYGRTFSWLDSIGFFTAEHIANDHKFVVTLKLEKFNSLLPIINNIRRILDLDADMNAIENNLKQHLPQLNITSGIRLPGTWSLFEAGIRAILGQQISVVAARKLVSSLVLELGESVENKKLFPSVEAILNSDLTFLKIPSARKQTLKNLAVYYSTKNLNTNIKALDIEDNPEQWRTINGIGAWTIDYAKMRGLSDPDIYLANDLGVKNALKQYSNPIDPKPIAPWRSYLTLQLWNQL